MHNALIVVKHEIKTMLSKPSFWLTTFLFPAAIIALSIGTQVLGRSALAEGGSNPITDAFGNKAGIGYVDLSGLIGRIPDRIAYKGFGDSEFVIGADALRRFPDEASAQAALEAGELRQYYVVPENFLKTGDLIMVDRNFSLFTSLGSSSLFEYVINFNLTGDAKRAGALGGPTAKLDTQRLAPQKLKAADNSAEAYIVPFAALFIFFFVITMSSGFMLQSVTKEKENRTVEILLLSLRPRELMLGKVLGLGLVALLQMAIWVGGGLLVLGKGQSLAAGLEQLPDGFIVWALLYFVLGYLLYASILGALGALAPTAREGAQFTFIALLPLMIPLWLSNTFIVTPNDGLSVFLSLFPLTAPTSMITRLAAGASVPAWQPIAGLIGLAITTYVFVLLSARFFRADTLLSGDSIKLKRIFQQLRS